MMKTIFSVLGVCLFTACFGQSKINELGTWCTSDLKLNANLEKGERVLHWGIGEAILEEENASTIDCAKYGSGTYKVYIENDKLQIRVETHEVAAPEIVTASFKVTNYLAAGVAFFEDTSVSVEKIVAWRWDFGNGETSTVQNPKVAFKEEKEYSVTLTVTSASGCKHVLTQKHIWSY